MILVYILFNNWVYDIVKKILLSYDLQIIGGIYILWHFLKQAEVSENVERGVSQITDSRNIYDIII